VLSETQSKRERELSLKREMEALKRLDREETV
jgi:hypothetical protein